MLALPIPHIPIATPQFVDYCIVCSRPCLIVKIVLQLSNSIGYCCSVDCHRAWLQRQLSLVHSLPPQETPHNKAFSGAKQKLRRPNNSQRTNPHKGERIQQTHQMRVIKPIYKDITKNSTSTLQANPKPQTSLPPVYAIIDTNALLQHLHQLLNLRAYQHLTLVIPSVVIHELDGLKKDAQVGTSARVAIHAIQQAFQESNIDTRQWIRGQQLHEALISGDDKNTIRNNDDSILNCALYYNKYIAPKNVVLVTSDTTLVLKATINGIRGSTVKDFLSSLPPLNLQPSALPTENTTQSTPRIVALLPHFPTSLWQHVLQFLAPPDLLHVNMVNRIFHDLTNDATLWRTSIKQFFNDWNEILIPKVGHPKVWYMQWRRSLLPC